MPIKILGSERNRLLAFGFGRASAEREARFREQRNVLAKRANLKGYTMLGTSRYARLALARPATSGAIFGG
jgi:hypothetical protein